MDDTTESLKAKYMMVKNSLHYLEESKRDIEFKLMLRMSHRSYCKLLGI